MIRCRPPLLGAWLLAASLLLPWTSMPSAEPEPGLPPVPRTIPVLPGTEDERPRSLDDDLQRRLRDAISARDAQIRALMDRAEGDLPATGGVAIEEADSDRSSRDKAWRELEQALAMVSDERRQQGDVLDTPAVLTDDYQLQSLTAHNQLSMVRSYKALLEDQDQPNLADLNRARDILRAISVEHLADHVRPQRVYLSFWFESELALRVSGEARRQHFEAARTAHQRLTTDWPGSVSLVISANTLLEQLEQRLAGDLAL